MNAIVFIILAVLMVLGMIGLGAGFTYDEEVVYREQRSREKPDDHNNNERLREARRGQSATWIMMLVGVAATVLALMLLG